MKVEGKALHINILFIIVIIILITGAVAGWKRGLLESVIRIISYILGILVLIIIAKGIGNFIQGSYAYVIMAFILLAAIEAIHKFIRFLFSTLKLVRALPIGKLADKLLGAVLGVVEAVLVVWLMFFIVGNFHTMNLTTWVQEQVSQSRFLTMLYYYHIEFLKQLLAIMHYN